MLQNNPIVCNPQLDWFLLGFRGYNRNIFMDNWLWHS